MLLNRFEYLFMNNPVRAAAQRHVEARRLLRMGGPVRGGRALEIGCGRGVGVGIVHHIPEWRDALAEVWRVLKPGGRFYAEEVLRNFLGHPITRRLFHHPQHDRFDREGFLQGLEEAGFITMASRETWGAMAWFVADKVTRANSTATTLL